MTLYKCHRTVLRDRERDVLQHSTDKIAAHNCALAERVTVHDHATKVGEAAIGNDDQVGEKRLLHLRAFPASLHAEHAPRERTLDQVRHRRLEEVDARCSPGVRAEVLDEAAVVERAAFGTGGVRDVHGLSRV